MILTKHRHPTQNAMDRGSMPFAYAARRRDIATVERFDEPRWHVNTFSA